MSIEAMKQAIAALEMYLVLDTVEDSILFEQVIAPEAITALRAAIEQAQVNEFRPDWDAMGALVAEQQRMATEIDRLKDALNKSELRLHDVAVHCERVERRLNDVNTAAMKLTRDLVCMDYYDDDRLDRDRVMERVMRWRTDWDKAMFEKRNK